MAASIPTPNPHSIRPRNTSDKCGAAAKTIHPTITEGIHVCNARFLPHLSMIGPAENAPTGEAAEWILAEQINL